MCGVVVKQLLVQRFSPRLSQFFWRRDPAERLQCKWWCSAASSAHWFPLRVCSPSVLIPLDVFWQRLSVTNPRHRTNPTLNLSAGVWRREAGAPRSSRLKSVCVILSYQTSFKTFKRLFYLGFKITFTHVLSSPPREEDPVLKLCPVVGCIVFVTSQEWWRFL